MIQIVLLMQFSNKVYNEVCQFQTHIYTVSESVVSPVMAENDLFLIFYENYYFLLLLEWKVRRKRENTFLPSHQPIQFYLYSANS